ncbi:MAG: hypothetical protein R3F13_16805 [Prosthecobacter sp.]
MNWREKIISLVLAFLSWFMIKAQDQRYSQPYVLPAPTKITSPAPPQLTPVLPPPAEVPIKLEPVVPLPSPPEAPEPGAPVGLGDATGL